MSEHTSLIGWSIIGGGVLAGLLLGLLPSQPKRIPPEPVRLVSEMEELIWGEAVAACLTQPIVVNGCTWAGDDAIRAFRERKLREGDGTAPRKGQL